MSEVARLRKLIELECEAMQRQMKGYAVTSSHEVIQHKYNKLSTAQEKLSAIIGEEEAVSIMVETYIRVIG